jgi:hypothetical protein
MLIYHFSIVDAPGLIDEGYGCELWFAFSQTALPAITWQKSLLK